MPEITSVEAIQIKLRQFDEQMEGAIAAAKALSRIRTDAQKLLSDAENACSKSDETLLKAEGVRLALQQLHQEWGHLKAEFDKSQADSKETRDLLLSELDSAIQSLDKKVAEAKEKLQITNEASLRAQADLLRRLDGDTRANAEVAANAKATTIKLARDVDTLVKTMREELQNDVRDNLHNAEDLLNSQFQDAKATIEEQNDTQRRLLRDEITAFREEIRQGTKEHQDAITREVTDFLNKQNALVQNLGQHIDSCQRVAQTLSTDLAQTRMQLSNLETSLKEQKKENGDQVASLSAKITEVSTQLGATIATLKRRSWFTGMK